MNTKTSRTETKAEHDRDIALPEAGVIISRDRGKMTSMPMRPVVYRGRFAPSPTGPLHFGSLVAAVGSYLDAKTRDGDWLVRIEDVDTPRVVPGSADRILRALEAYGFEWDDPVLYQSRRNEAYRDALDRLHHLGLVYGCTCSRKLLLDTAKRGIDGPVYPGTCRGRKPSHEQTALRLIVPDERIAFDDALQGRVACDVARECGDFVLRRADGVFTYQLAVVTDDADQGITHVVRGADLLTSTPRQIVLQRYLGLPTPHYLHLPIALDEIGEKLSKRSLAAPILVENAVPTLVMALRFLGVPNVEQPGSVAEFWSMAQTLWPAGLGVSLRGRRHGDTAPGSGRAFPDRLDQPLFKPL